MYINSFINELSKKIETVEMQLNVFENKVNRISEVKNMITLKTLKDIDNLVGKDLVLLSKEEFANVLDAFKFDEQEEKIKIFFNASVAIKVNQKLLSDGEIVVNNDEQISSYIKWLDEQARYIREYIREFNENNKEYYNSLKVSDSLYKKYLGYFKNEKLIKPIYNIEEFNEVIKKSGIITSEKWQLLKYVGEKNIEFHKNEEVNKKEEKIEYSDQEIFSFVDEILKREEKLVSIISQDVLEQALEIIDADEESIAALNLSSDDVAKYQKIPILDTLKKLYAETKELVKDEKDEDARKIEKNMKDLVELVQSYDVIKKIEG